jgi:hypothetical protein
MTTSSFTATSPDSESKNQSIHRSKTMTKNEKIAVALDQINEANGRAAVTRYKNREEYDAAIADAQIAQEQLDAAYRLPD